MQANGNEYGLSSDTSKVDSHTLKNMEWGAVAYLTNNDYAGFVTWDGSSWFCRGGHDGSKTEAGVFYFDWSNGDDFNSTRASLIVF